DELRGAGVPVIDSPEATPFEPDLIHGQHNLETLVALTCFQKCPAVYSWQNRTTHDLPPLHSRSSRYVSGFALTDKAAEEAGLTRDKCLQLPAPVALSDDLSSAKRGPHFRKAAFLGDLTTPQLKDICEVLGIDFDERPTELGEDHDLVFASGRFAIEALAAGYPVVLAGPEGVGAAVTEDIYDDLRSTQFVPTTRLGIEDALDVALASLRMNDNLGVARRIRKDYDYDKSLSDWIRLYKEAVQERPARVNARREQREVAQFLQRLAVREDEQERQVQAVVGVLRELLNDWSQGKPAPSNQGALKTILADGIFSPSVWEEVEEPRESRKPKIAPPKSGRLKPGAEFRLAVDWVLYQGARFGKTVLKYTPISCATALGRFAGEMAYWFCFRQRRIAIDSLRRAFPDREEVELHWLAHENFRRLGENRLCGAKALCMSGDDAQQLFEISGVENLGTENPLFAMAQLGNLELYAHTASALGEFEAVTTYKPNKWPRCNRLIRQLRENTGGHYIELGSDSSRLSHAMLNPGRALGLTTDIPAADGQKTVEVSLFGQTCHISPAPVTLARRFGCRLHVATCFRSRFGRWRFEFSPEISIYDERGSLRSNTEVMQDIYSIFENAIDRDPANWNWTQPRFAAASETRKSVDEEDVPQMLDVSPSVGAS
ncbi:MAG: hypothetical protein AAF585_24825, partial [Verrucomicrobiota bacterium]